MRLFFFALLFCFIYGAAPCQQLSQISFASASTLSSFAFLTDQGILIRVSDEGAVLEYGTELASERASNYYAPKLQPYLGRVTYFGAEGDSVSKGKIKSIGTCVMTYYGAYEVEEKRGKLKMIGNTPVDYFTKFEGMGLKGKIKSAGSIALQYYSMYENESIKGKLKSVGGTTISYNSVFDDKIIQGKVKSIGSVAYNWGGSQDTRYAGALKSGSYRQNISGITYILR